MGKMESGEVGFYLVLQEPRMSPFEDSEKTARRLRGSACSWPLAVALSRSKLPRSRSLISVRRPRRHFEFFTLDAPIIEIFTNQTKKKSSSLFRSNWAARARLWLARTLPGVVVGTERSETSGFFERFRHARALAADGAPGQQNIVKTGTRSTSELSRGKTKATKTRSEGTFDGAWCTTGAQTAHPEALGASLGRPGGTFGRLLDALGLPGASPDWPWGGIWASKSRPKRIWTRPRNGLERPNWPKIDFSSILVSFSSIFERFFIHFRLSRLRRRH